MNANTIRWGVVLVALLAALYALAPTLADLQDGALDGEIPNADDPAIAWVLENGQPLNLGLDLQGGLLLQYNVDVNKAVQDKLNGMARDVETRLKDAEEGLDVTAVHNYGEDFITVTFADPSKKDLLDEDMMNFFQQLNKIDEADGFRLAIDPDYVEETKEFAIQQAIETIRQRVDELGVSEPSIVRQGRSDIVVQLPGLKENDVERAKKLIGQTAQLEFRLVDDDGTDQFFNSFSGRLPEGFNLRVIDGGSRSVTHSDIEALRQFFEGKVPDDHIVGYQYHPIYQNKAEEIIDEERSYWKSYYVFKNVELTGDYISDSRVAVDQQFNRPYVALNFDSKGAQLFHDLSKNVGKRMAIMLGDTVKSAPVFNEEIPGGRAQINLGSMQSYTEVLQDAEDLVIVLRHGALPAPMEKQFETVVGPTLGQDSIDSSTRALGIGLLLVVIFMLIYYRASGFISVLALLLNIIFVMAGLSGLGATLTLPGIAGIILTVGMAVDANVIIFERIREEIDKGKRAREAVASGFDAALSAVMDANVTTGIAGIVLMEAGTGPVRGFAVTLLIGIVSTIFTAVFISRLFFDIYVSKDRESLSI